MKVVIILNSAQNLINFRQELILFLAQKHKVIIICPYDKELENLRLNSVFCYLDINRKSKNQLRINTFFKIFKLLKNIKPNYVLNFTIKPNIYGSIICKFLGIKNINTVTGLGNIFINKNFINNFIFFLYRSFVKKAYFNLFHNIQDLAIFTNYKKIDKSKFGVVNGSGLDLNFYQKVIYPNESQNINVLFIGRIIKEKGIFEYCEAAKLLLKNNKNINFYAAGEMEDEITKKLKNFIDKKTVNFIGHIKNIHDKIAECHLVVLPSYREGLLYSLLISCAIGRPIITTNVPGCKEIVTHNFNGYLCEKQNYKKLSFLHRKIH